MTRIETFRSLNSLRLAACVWGKNWKRKKKKTSHYVCDHENAAKHLWYHNYSHFSHSSNYNPWDLKGLSVCYLVSKKSFRQHWCNGQMKMNEGRQRLGGTIWGNASENYLCFIWLALVLSKYEIACINIIPPSLPSLPHTRTYALVVIILLSSQETAVSTCNGSIRDWNNLTWTGCYQLSTHIVCHEPDCWYHT